MIKKNLLEIYFKSGNQCLYNGYIPGLCRAINEQLIIVNGLFPFLNYVLAFKIRKTQNKKITFAMFKLLKFLLQ